MSQIKRLFSEYGFKRIAVFWLDQWLIIIFSLLGGYLGFVIKSMVYKLTFKRLGGLFYVRPKVAIEHSYGMSVGRNCHINYGTYLDARGGIRLGNNVLIGPNCSIVSSNHKARSGQGNRLKYGHDLAPVAIGNNVWIGSNCSIMPGVSIGENSIIAAGSVVLDDVPDNVLAAGVPAKVRKIYD